MKELYKLREFLFKYIGNYLSLEKQADDFSYNISLYEDIINILSHCVHGNYDEILTLNILLDTLFGNKYDDLIQCIYSNKKLSLLNIRDKNLITKINGYFDEIKREYNSLKEKHYELVKKLNNDKEKYISARRTISSLKYFQIISKDDIRNISLLLKTENNEELDCSMVVESLFVHNKNVLSRQKGFVFSDKYKFVNLLSLGFEKIELPDVSDESKLNKIADAIIDIFENYDERIETEDYAKILPVIGVEVNDSDELKYVLIKVLESIQIRMSREIEALKDEDFIMDLEIKNMIASLCYELINRYIFIRNYMDSEVEKYEKEELSDEPLEVEEEVGKKKNLFYLMNSNGKCYFLSDVENIEYEYLGKIYDYIEEFRNGTIAVKDDRAMVTLSKMKKFKEIRGDQIRIIYKKIGDNDYLIYGVFIKKDDKKFKFDYYKVGQRIGKVSDDPLGIESQFCEYVNSHKRKWSR